MFVDATPGDELLKMLKDTEKKHMISEDFRIKFVSKAGVKLKSLLQNRNIKGKTCNDNGGNPCVYSEGKGIQNFKCKQNRVSYFAKCKSCALQGKDRTYHGETARNLHVRSQEHYSAMMKESKNSFMHKHIIKEHGGNQQTVEFEWGISGKFAKPLYRQLKEAICIESQSITESLNSKNEFFHQDIRRVGLHKMDNKNQCNYCSKFCESESDLHQHEKYFHIRYKCQKCDYVSFGERDLKSHINNVHTNSAEQK